MNKIIKGIFSKKAKYNASFLSEFQNLVHQQSLTSPRFSLSKDDFYPCLSDKTSLTGFDRHYVYHPAWAARILQRTNPEKHIDISSTLHFCSIISAFIPTEFYDYRPALLELNNLTCKAGNLLNLPFNTSSIASLSCMHTLEHIGLGRYGDPLDYDGDIKAINELKRVLKPFGNLLIAVPMGKRNKICFNAHRIYTKEQVLSLFADLELLEFALIPENDEDGGLVVDPSDQLLDKQSYGCGCFWFTKR